MYGLAERDIEGYRRLAARHHNRKPVEWWLEWAANAGREFMKDGEEAAARKIFEGSKAERRLTDYDRQQFKEHFVLE